MYRVLVTLFAETTGVVHRWLLCTKRWYNLFSRWMLLLLLHHNYLLLVTKVASLHNLVVVYIEFNFLVACSWLLDTTISATLHRGCATFGHIMLTKHQLWSQLDGCIALVLTRFEGYRAFVVTTPACSCRACLGCPVVRDSCTAGERLGWWFLGCGAYSCLCSTSVLLQGSKRTRLFAMVDEGRDCLLLLTKNLLLQLLLLLLLTSTLTSCGTRCFRPRRLLGSHCRSRNLRLLSLLLLRGRWHLYLLMSKHGRCGRCLLGVLHQHLAVVVCIIDSGFRRVSQRAFLKVQIASRHRRCVLLLVSRQANSSLLLVIELLLIFDSLMLILVSRLPRSRHDRLAARDASIAGWRSWVACLGLARRLLISRTIILSMIAPCGGNFIVIVGISTVL